jgi:hypothetical protein
MHSLCSQSRGQTTWWRNFAEFGLSEEARDVLRRLPVMKYVNQHWLKNVLKLSVGMKMSIQPLRHSGLRFHIQPLCSQSREHVSANDLGLGVADEAQLMSGGRRIVNIERSFTSGTGRNDDVLRRLMKKKVPNGPNVGMMRIWRC